MAASRFYVYALIDPRDGEVFYVGKGCGNRVSDHTRLVRAGKKDSNDIKRLRIAAILATGGEPFEFIVRDQLSEAEAVTIEHRLILGMDHLTNILSKGWARSPAELARIERRADLRNTRRAWDGKAFTAQRERFFRDVARGYRLQIKAPEGWRDITDDLLASLNQINSLLHTANAVR
jgi:hypothetical protein